MKALVHCGIRWAMVAVVAGLMGFGTVQASTIYVSTAGSDANDGLSWTTAKKSVQAGLNTAVSGDQVWVAAGTYVQCITLKAGVGLYGGFAGTETDLGQRNRVTNVTVLDGNQVGRVVTGPASALAGTGIDGFTIRNGHTSYGGGVYCSYSFVAIANNTISGNSAAEGGAIYLSYSTATVVNNTILGNSSGYGGAIYCVGSGALINNNTITGNSASAWGGGIYCAGASTPPTIANNTITGNGAAIGGGVYSDGCRALIANDTITGNSAGSGGGIYCTHDAPSIVNTIVAFNTSGIGADDKPSVRYNCVYGNTVYNYFGIADPTGTNGNISADPKLAQPIYVNVHIQPGSPCVDAGDDSVVQVTWTDMDGQARKQGSHVDIGADESDGTAWPGAAAVIVRVSPSGSDANDGASWGLAKRTVQAGIDTASPAGGEVWVKAGTYAERIILRGSVCVYGGFAGTETLRSARDWSHNVSILDGGQAGSVVTALWCAATIDGLTIGNGTGALSGSNLCGGGIYCPGAMLTIANDVITGNSAYSGGGIYCGEPAPTITNCTITSNTATYGGGISCGSSSVAISDSTITANTAPYGGGVYCSGGSPAIRNNTISGNSAPYGGTDSGYGGGIYCSSSAATITNNQITDNSGCRGAGVSCNNGTPAIVGNTITGNSAYPSGGGIYCTYDTATVVSNTIAGNHASGNGGGIHCLGSASTMANNRIVGNSAVTSGGGVYCSTDNARPVIADSTIVANSANSGGGMYCSLSASAWVGVRNTIIAFNSSGVCLTGGGSLWADYSCVYGNTAYNYSGVADPTGTNGNISADPKFVRAASPGKDGTWGTADDDYGDQHLMPGSRCIDAGLNVDVPADTADINGNGNRTEPLPLDLAGAKRFVDDPTTPDTGNGSKPIVDIGAYEYQLALEGDVDGDGHVDVVDLLYFVDAFGSVAGDGGYNVACDFNNDGSVDVVDLLYLVEVFGT